MRFCCYNWMSVILIVSNGQEEIKWVDGILTILNFSHKFFCNHLSLLEPGERWYLIKYECIYSFFLKLINFCGELCKQCFHFQGPCYLNKLKNTAPVISVITGPHSSPEQFSNSGCNFVRKVKMVFQEGLWILVSNIWTLTWEFLIKIFAGNMEKGSFW